VQNNIMEDIIKVLFMDDEIHDPEVATVNEAINELRKSGCVVTVADKISDTINAFENEYYDVFVLDIDMHKIADAFQDKRGTIVADIFKSQDNDCSVIMYSAAGTVEDLYVAANCHVYGYVYKNEDNAVEKLVKMVKEAALNSNNSLVLPRPRKAGKILIAETGMDFFSAETLKEIVCQTGDFETVFCNFNEMPDRLHRDEYAAGVVLTKKISTRPGNIKLMDSILSVQPLPNIIVGYPGTNNRDPAIFHIVNSRPFRFINMMLDNLDRTLTKAIKQAVLWYGGNETFQADMQFVQRAADTIDWDALHQEFMIDNFDNEYPEEENC